jgi:hypothetical protein
VDLQFVRWLHGFSRLLASNHLHGLSCSVPCLTAAWQLPGVLLLRSPLLLLLLLRSPLLHGLCVLLLYPFSCCRMMY